MSKTGRPRNFPPCPDCQQPIKSSHSPYFKCGCRGYIVRGGKLCPTKRRKTKRESSTVNLSPIHLKLALHIRAGINAYRELNGAIGNGPTTGWMHQYLKELRAEGLVAWDPTQKRTLQLTEQGRAALANYVLLPDGGVGKWEAVEPVKEPIYCTAEEYEALQEAVR